MTDPILSVHHLNLTYAKQLTEDIPADRMCHQPAEGINHPAWILGHLTVVGHAGLGLLGLDEPAPDGWAEIFGARTTPTEEPSIYPDKHALVDAFEHVQQRTVEGYQQVDPATLDQPNTNQIKDVLPTKRALLTHVMTTHQSVHLGQLSAWRRMLAMPNVR